MVDKKIEEKIRQANEITGTSRQQEQDRMDLTMSDVMLPLIECTVCRKTISIDQ